MPKKQKKFLSLLFLSGLLMLLVACGKTAYSPIVAIANESEYEEVVAKDVTYLYFGFDDCPYCKEFRPILEKELTQTGETAYYYNTKSASMMPTMMRCWIPTASSLFRSWSGWRMGKRSGPSIWTPLRTCRHYWRQSSRRGCPITTKNRTTEKQECPRMSDNYKESDNQQPRLSELVR